MKRMNPERLAELVLARLACGERTREADASRALYTLVKRDCSASEWKELFLSALAELRSSGDVDADKLALTSRGRTRLAQALGLRSLPAALSWDRFRSKYLPRLFLELPESSAAPNCAAAILAKRLGVPYDGRSTPAHVADTWLASMLSLEKLSLDQIRKKLLASELGLPDRRNSAELLRLAATQLADAPKGDAESVRNALARRWLLEGDAQPRGSSPPQQALGHFVRRVQQAADSPQARHFGPEKVFIGSVWQALASEPDMARLGEEGFKRLLVEAHRSGSLVLARADLVAAMDPRDVRSSETKHHNATYHFIQRGQPA